MSMTAMTRLESRLTAMTMTMTAMKMIGLEFRLTWIMKVLGLEVGVGEGVEAVGLSGFVVEVVVVVGFKIWCWWAMVCFELCFGLWMKMVVVWWWLLVVGSNVVAVDCV